MKKTREADFEELYQEATKALSKASSPKEINEVRVNYLGKKGKFTKILRSLGTLPKEERPVVGRLANKYSKELEKKFGQRLGGIEEKKMARGFEEEIDLTLPGKRPLLGKKHLVTQIIEEIVDIFIGLGYKVAEGPEVELDYYNFEALNIPQDHPARSLMDTFYVKSKVQYSGSPKSKVQSPKDEEKILLRTHTSPVQIRVMEKQEPPVYIIAPGKAYRHDVADPSHTPMFHQVEGLAVDRGITFGDLKGTLEVFVHSMFGEDRAIRMRPHFFPFTEPSAEVDVSCSLCKGKGCRLCGGNGWLEILGCGMVDPNVLEEVGYDFQVFTGFAFGMGVERIAVLKYGLKDIRLLFENDLRFLVQF